MTKSNSQNRTENARRKKAASGLDDAVNHSTGLSETQDIAEVVWKHFEVEIREVFAQVQAEISKRGHP